MDLNIFSLLPGRIISKSILKNIISFVNPDVIIQISSKQKRKNHVEKCVFNNRYNSDYSYLGFKKTINPLTEK